jgi:hypothetical protein
VNDVEIDEDEDFLQSFAKIISKFGEVFSKYLIEQLPLTMPFFELMLQLTSYAPNADIPQITFFFWFNLEDALDYTNELEKKTLPAHVVQHGNQIMYRLLEILILQMRYPSDRELSDWKKDHKDKMKNHRVECADTALYCYYNLQEKALELLIHLFQREIEVLSSDSQYGTQGLEAIVYTLKCFAEAINCEESRWIPVLFQESSISVIQAIVGASRDGFRQMRLTMAGCCGNYAEWLANHSEYLAPTLKYLLYELEHCDQPTSAAIALTELSSLCQIPLSKHADEVLNMCMSTLHTVPANIQSRIIQSMLSIIQALPSHEASPRSRFMLGGIVDQLGQDILQWQDSAEPEAQKESLLLHLDFLKSFCKGCNQSIVELEVDIDSSLSVEDMEVSSKLLQIIGAIFQRWLHELQIVQVTCEVIRDFTRCDNTIIKSILPRLLPTLTGAFSVNQQSCLLSSATAILDHSTPQKIQLVQQDYDQCYTQLVITFAEKCSSIEKMQQDPDVPFDFFEMLISIVRKLPNSVKNYPEHLCRLIFLDCLVLGLELREHFAIQGILKFLKEFLATGYEGSALEDFTKRILSIIGEPVIYQLLKVRAIDAGNCRWPSFQFGTKTRTNTSTIPNLFPVCYSSRSFVLSVTTWVPIAQSYQG